MDSHLTPGIALGVIIVFALCLIGYINNIVLIVRTARQPINGLFLLRLLGMLFPPMGAVMGIFWTKP